MPKSNTPLKARPFLAPVDPRVTSTATATAANVVYWMRLPEVDVPSPLTKGRYLWVSGAANADIAILTADRVVLEEADALAATFSRASHSGPVAAATANTWQILTFPEYVHRPGVPAWAAIGFDAAATILRATANSNGTLVGGVALAKAGAYSSGVPASLAGSITATALVPVLVLS